MKRAPIVLSATAAGVVGILSYHTAAPSASALASSSSSAAAATTTSASTSSSATTAATTSTAQKTTAASAKTRTVTGEDVNYQYGDLEVKVTATGSKITNISVARLDVTDPHSEAIDQYAIPQLQQQALAAQSAKINGISGASYTSAAYEQSLQSALDKLA